METQTIPVPDLPASKPGPNRDIYRGVVLVLLGAAFLGTVAAIAGALAFAIAVLLDVALTLAVSTGILAGVAASQSLRTRPRSEEPPIPRVADAEDSETPSEALLPASRLKRFKVMTRLEAASTRVSDWSRDLGLIGSIRVGTAVVGTTGIVFIFLMSFSSQAPSPLVAASVAAACLGVAGLAATAIRYLAELDPALLPEAPGLCRGARVLAWLLVLAAISVALSWAGQDTMVQVLHFVMLTVDAAVCYGLLRARQPEGEISEVFPLDLGVFSLLGSRTNILASILDAGERQLGIDLRSTWALTVVRRSIVPLVIGLCLVAWLSTSLTVVGVEEQGLVERLGVPVGGRPLTPGLHVHWPWPVDHVFRIPVQRVQSLTVGHEGEEEGGPENVLWAVEHAPNEYTLLLGNGRDLITIDAGVQFRIVDARAWRYHCQNPADALKAIAYRAVMRNTVNRTLSDALSENVVTLTNTMRDMVQKEADALGLGVAIESFTVGGMHPPVPVAADYEAVVSAELGKVTAVASAQAFRNQTVPAAQAEVIASENTARADGALALGVAAGEAWSFRTIESQYRSSPEEYFFRRRLEALESGLGGRHFTVIDSRIQRDGGELWLTQ